MGGNGFGNNIEKKKNKTSRIVLTSEREDQDPETHWHQWVDGGGGVDFEDKPESRIKMPILGNWK